MNDSTGTGLLRKPFGGVQRDAAVQDLSRSLGAAPGLLSVTLTTLYGQTRVFYAMSRDGLLPEVFSRISPRWRTSRRGTLIVGGLVALAAALLPISILSDIVSLGTALAFSIVALSVMWLRSTQPDRHRPFRVPFDGIRIGGAWIGVVPVLASVFLFGLGRRHSKLRGART